MARAPCVDSRRVLARLALLLLICDKGLAGQWLEAKGQLGDLNIDQSTSASDGRLRSAGLEEARKNRPGTTLQESVSARGWLSGSNLARPAPVGSPEPVGADFMWIATMLLLAGVLLPTSMLSYVLIVFACGVEDKVEQQDWPMGGFISSQLAAAAAQLDAAGRVPWTSQPRLVDGRPLQERIQWYAPPRRPYSRRELLADRIVNFLGAALALIGAPALVITSYSQGNEPLKQVAFWVFGAGLITMLTLSAMYHHWSWDWRWGEALYSLDTIGISAMIMGCYTPLMVQAKCYRVLFLVLVLGGAGWAMEIWKVSRGRYDLSGSDTWTPFDLAHLARSLVMGWAVLIDWRFLNDALPRGVLWMIVSGGLMFTGGVAFLVRSRMEFHMPIWHSFVLAGSAAFFAVNLTLVGIPRAG